MYKYLLQIKHSMSSKYGPIKPKKHPIKFSIFGKTPSSPSPYPFTIISPVVNNIFCNCPIIKIHHNPVKYVKQKYQFFGDIIKSRSISAQNIEEFVDVFSKIQRVILAINRIIFKTKYKNATVQVSDDLYLNPINPASKKSIMIYQNNNKYLFTLTDITNICLTALTNSPYNFPEPLTIKNPYTNIPFNKSTLYNIFFFIKTNNYITPVLLQSYFLLDFDLRLFKTKNISQIREYKVENYFNNCSTTKLLSLINTIIRFYKPSIHIHADFPVKTLIQIFKPYLKLYFIIKFGDNETRVDDAKFKLYNSLREFFRYNPFFGRIYIKHLFETRYDSVSNKTFTKRVVLRTFNATHLSFNTYRGNFYNTHIQNTNRRVIESSSDSSSEEESGSDDDSGSDDNNSSTNSGSDDTNDLVG
jgi:hypothetical protein